MRGILSSIILSVVAVFVHGQGMGQFTSLDYMAANSGVFQAFKSIQPFKFSDIKQEKSIIWHTTIMESSIGTPTVEGKVEAIMGTSSVRYTGIQASFRSDFKYDVTYETYEYKGKGFAFWNVTESSINVTFSVDGEGKPVYNVTCNVTLSDPLKMNLSEAVEKVYDEVGALIKTVPKDEIVGNVSQKVEAYLTELYKNRTAQFREFYKYSFEGEQLTVDLGLIKMRGSMQGLTEEIKATINPYPTPNATIPDFRKDDGPAQVLFTKEFVTDFVKYPLLTGDFFKWSFNS